MTAFLADVGSTAKPVRRLLTELCCAVFGHRVDCNLFFAGHDRPKHCPCGATILQEDGSITRVRHNLRCFLFGHYYRSLGCRANYCEYSCEDCGHPLLIHAGRSFRATKLTTMAQALAGQREASMPETTPESFHKAVSFLCIVFGHRINTVTERHHLAEYACWCGHSFLLREKGRKTFRHPPVCFFKGHYLNFVGRRGEYSEYLCGNCGHTFCFNGNRWADQG